MEWLNKIDRIVVLNLPHREDRLLAFTEMMEKFRIPFERINAIYDRESGARGLRDTMRNLFSEAVERGLQHLLVFEDDAEIIVGSERLNAAMDGALGQLPENYQMMFLGCQLTGNNCRFFSTNLIRVNKAFSTHAVLYSLQGMKEILARDFGYPIDNWYVEEIEPMGRSYCTFPFLVSQRDGYSDIGLNFISWKPFLEQRFNQQIGHIRR
jgi:hypothetical protein